MLDQESPEAPPASLPQAKGTPGRNLPHPQQLMEDVLSHRGWDIREGQKQMVEATARGIKSDNGLTGVSVNAPVGTGKTLGYLLGSLPSNRRVLVCTSTKALQDQIANEELPTLRGDLKELYDFDLKFAVLKGKSNYICLSKAEDFIGGKRGEDDDPLFEEIAKSLEPEYRPIIEDMIRRTKEAMEEQDVSKLDVGDLLGQVPHDVRSSISSSSGCGFCRTRWWYEPEDDGSDEYAFSAGIDGRAPIPIEQVILESKCAFRTAYALCMQADVVVINTSLLAAEMMKSRNVWGLVPQLIPGAGVIVVDEAHHLTSILTGAMSNQLVFRDFHQESDSLIKKLVRKMPSWSDDLEQIKDIVKTSENEFYVMSDLDNRDAKREAMVKSLSKATAQIIQIVESLPMSKVNPDDIKVVNKNVGNLRTSLLDPMFLALGQMTEKVTYNDKDGNEVSDYVYKVTFDSNSWNEHEERTPDNHFGADLVPIDISFWFNEIGNLARRQNQFMDASEDSNSVQDGKSLILLCSGTITEEDTVRVGMKRDFHVAVDSPFDPVRVRFCVPADLIAPKWDNKGMWINDVWENAAEPAIRAIGGRTLFLTTSYDTIYGDKNGRYDGFLHLITESFGDEHLILHQNNGMTRQELIRAKKDNPTSILIATTSFWEGIDIPGEALMLTIMDKMMFPQQDDPTVEAAREYFERLGESPFTKVDVNSVAKMMAQGEGRTQRKVTDLGGTLLLDSRQASAKYGPLASGLIAGNRPYTNKIDAFCNWLEWCADNIDAESVPDPDEHWHGLRRNIIRPRRGTRRRRSAADS